MFINQSQVSQIYAISLARNQKVNVVFPDYNLCCWWQKKFGSKYRKLQPHKSAKFLKICKYSISFNQ